MASSFDLQTGRAGQVPNEELIYLVPRDGLYAVVVSHRDGGIPDWLQVTVRGSLIEHHTLYGSIVNPAESANPGMLAVGAAHWDYLDAVLLSSSRGPTPDGRVKPDIVGATCGRTALVPLGPYGTGFCGTSQAAPHLAGMAALVRQRFPHLTPTQVAAYLESHAEQRGVQDPNNTWGHGFAVLPVAAVTAGATPGSPTITGIAPATGSLTVLWDAPAQTGGAAVTAYDLRYIRASADETVDANWTLLEDVWDGDLSRFYHRITGLATGTRYDMQVRAVNANGAGPWSATASGTPAQWRAARSFSADSVGPGAEVVVTVTAAGYGLSGQVVEILPDGFGYVSSSLPGAVDRAGQVITFTLLGDTSFTYTVTAPDAAGSYSFDGILRNLEDEFIPVGGDSSVRVGAAPGGHMATHPITMVRINSPIWVVVNFTEPVYGFTAADVDVGNGTISNFSGSDGDTAYTFDLTPNAIGEVTVDIPADAAVDADGNGNEPFWASFGIPYDDDDSGGISKAEAIAAIHDYFGGNINKAQAIAVIRLYFASATVDPVPRPGSVASDRAALVALYNATGGPYWNRNYNWLSDVPISEWSGVTTDDNGRVTGLYLGSNQLSGEIPPELVNLVNLTEVQLNDNQLSGEIPEEFGNLYKLKSLDLSSNQLGGRLPAELGNLFNLEVLELEHNHLLWEIPGELGNLANLVSLNLRGNRLSGEIPTELGRLLQLRKLELPYNRLSGAIPAELGLLRNLQRIMLHDNYLSGAIPSELGNLANLDRLELARNGLAGEIPAELGSLSTLTYLSLSDNQLRGKIPAELGSLPRLWFLETGPESPG